MGHSASLTQAVQPALASSAAGGANSASSAYLGAPVTAGRPIEAENFDNGGPGIGYSIGTVVHSHVYRESDVTVQAGGSNGYNVGHTAAGQWLAYTINAPASGDYVFSATVACPCPGAQFHVSFDGVDCTGSLNVPQTKDWFEWNTVTSRPFTLPAGTHVMRLCIDRNAANCAAAGNFDTLFVTPVRPGSALYWTPAADAPVARFEGVGHVIHGKLYTFGGYTSVVPYAVSKQASVYDPATQKWSDLGIMPIPEPTAGLRWTRPRAASCSSVAGAAPIRAERAPKSGNTPLPAIHGRALLPSPKRLRPGPRHSSTARFTTWAAITATIAPPTTPPIMS